MRIAFVTFEYPPFIIGGAGIYAENLTKELAKLGHEVYVFTPSIENVKWMHHNEEIKNLQIINVKINNKLSLRALQFWIQVPKYIKRIEKKKKFDIVHFNSMSYWSLKNKLVKAPHVITIHHVVRNAIQTNNFGFIFRIRSISGENNFIIPFIEEMC